VGAPRDRSCARRERWGQLSFRAVARRGSGCRRSYARYGPIPLPLRGLGVCPSMGGLIVAVEEKQSSSTWCVVVMALGALGAWGRGGGGGSGKGEAFGVPQRGTVDQPGVKPRVWRTTGAF